MPAPILGSPLHAALLGIGTAAAVAGTAGLLLSDVIQAVPALLALLSGLSLTGLSFHAHRLLRVIRALRRESDASTALERRLMAQNLSLRSQVELLSAMREVSRLAVDERELDRLASKIFQILEGLLGADEITLYLYDPESEVFVPRLHQSGGKLYARKELSTAEARKSFPPRTLPDAGMVRESEGDLCTLGLPLVAEGETLGLLSAGFRMEPGEGDGKMEQRELALKDIARHVALAVRTLSIHTEAIRDGLTGLFTRKEFDSRLAHWTDWSTKCGDPFCLVLIDIDHFKQVNDRYGHPAGDEVLRQVARLVRQTIRGTDSAYRFGGEELAVLLPQSDLTKAERAAERIRGRIEKTSIPTGDGQSIQVTVSAGVAPLAAEEGASPCTATELIQRADAALYRAKREGRNRVCLAVPDPSGASAIRPE